MVLDPARATSLAPPGGFVALGRLKRQPGKAAVRQNCLPRPAKAYNRVFITSGGPLLPAHGGASAARQLNSLNLSHAARGSTRRRHVAF